MHKKQRRANIRGIRKTHTTIKYQFVYPSFKQNTKSTVFFTHI
jgi:hypothetical protein